MRLSVVLEGRYIGYKFRSFFLNRRWSVSSYIVFPVTGLVVTSLLVVVLIEKFICVPKRLSRLILHLTGNKMLHQLMAITNILTLLSCVLLPMVRLLHFHWICPQWGQILWKNAVFWAIIASNDLFIFIFSCGFQNC